MPLPLRRTFGYERAELIGALINLTTLFVIALYLIYVSVRRFLNPPEIQGTVMLIVGGIAFVEDAISTWLLYKDMKGSLNIRTAFIHMFADIMATAASRARCSSCFIRSTGSTWLSRLR